MKFYIMDSSGHTTLEFTDRQKKEAMKVFEQLVEERGLLPATRKAGGGGDYTVIRDPEQIQDETVFASQLKGG